MGKQVDAGAADGASAAPAPSGAVSGEPRTNARDSALEELDGEQTAVGEGPGEKSGMDAAQRSVNLERAMVTIPVPEGQEGAEGSAWAAAQPDGGGGAQGAQDGGSGSGSGAIGGEEPGIWDIISEPFQAADCLNGTDKKPAGKVEA